MGLLDWVRGRRAPLLHIAGDVGSGPPVILIHGIASSSVTFQFLVPLIADRHRVISIDLMGFGGSPAPADATYTVEEHVAALERTIRSLRLRERFVLVGHSMGSLIGARFAAENSKRLTKLVLVAPPVYVHPESVADPVDRAALGLFLKIYDYLRNNKEFTIRNASWIGKLAPIKNVLEVTEQNWGAFVLSLENSIESQTTISDLASVTVPVEVIYGTLDPFLAPAGLRIVEQLRNVNVHKVEGNDHVVRKRMARVVATAVG
jgi:cis-3-alkyl-4-acyloxetan-2-one decarboxylase